MAYVFGPFRADRAAYRVWKDGTPLELTPKLIDLLLYFVERPATLVTKEQLLDDVWPGANVTENALAQAVSDLRDALGDAASAPTYIRTIARRGYRFIAPVSTTGDGPADDPHPRRTPAASRAIAVLDFTNLTEDADVAWLSAGIAETVTSDLAALGHFRVIDRWRVVQAARRVGTTMHDVGAAVGAALVATGSFQRRGPHLRITARLVDLDHGDALADAKVDGQLDDVFGLQDEIVSAFARELGLADARPSRRTGVRETSSLGAYRAYMEGWLKLESLDTDLVAASIQDFHRALSCDAGYAAAYTGLANAEFVAYEMTRTARQPNIDALASGIDHARRAIKLDPQLAEAHATLSFLLASALRFDEARAAAEEAVHLAPDDWRHQYRLGHASWGLTRLRALERARAFYPEFAYALFETAMVLVARGDLDAAARVARDGIGGQERDARSASRFPAIGFHWLAGALAAVDRRPDAAIEHFDREIALVDRRRLYGPEYGAAACVGRGHAELTLGLPDRALASFRAAFAHMEDQRAILGEAQALTHLGDRGGAEAAWARVNDAHGRLLATGRHHEGRIVAACAAALRGDVIKSVSGLLAVLDDGPPSALGWTIPIEPCFAGLRSRPEFGAVLRRLAERAG